MNEFLTFIRNEQIKSNVMTSARIQPFCKKLNFNIGCSDGFGVCPGNNTEKKLALCMYKNHFRLFRKSNGISFNKTLVELKFNFKVVHNVISDKYAKSFMKNEDKAKKSNFN